MSNTTQPKLDLVILNQMIVAGKDLCTITSEHEGFFHEMVKTVDYSKYQGWRSQVIEYVRTRLTTESQYYKSLNGTLGKPSYLTSVMTALELIESLVKDAKSGVFASSTEIVEAQVILSQITSKFHNIVRQLRRRYNDRPTLDVKDEYDVQDLLHALLQLYFEDIRPEEVTPSYGGASSRMDFLLPEHDIVVEVKKTRPNLRRRQLIEELIIDTASYQTHPNCKHLCCFVYDPDGYIDNPAGVERDLSGQKDKIYVTVIINPSH
jgi:hypothetical protein